MINIPGKIEINKFLDDHSQYEIKKRFAFLPKVSVNGERIWFQVYFRRRTFIWGIAGEGAVFGDEQNFLPAEYTLWLLKNN